MLFNVQHLSLQTPDIESFVVLKGCLKTRQTGWSGIRSTAHMRSSVLVTGRSPHPGLARCRMLRHSVAEWLVRSVAVLQSLPSIWLARQPGVAHPPQ